jgi:hypothetical protein
MAARYGLRRRVRARDTEGFAGNSSESCGAERSIPIRSDSLPYLAR